MVAVSLSTPQPRNRHRIILAAVSGNFAEWYEFGVYGVVATVIAGQFFPKADPTLALINTYAIFAISFIARPVGAALIGRLGDVWGRRNALMLTVALTSAATAAIGLLPTYTQVGYFAPLALLLCRLLQGLAAGGEYGSAVTFAYEHDSGGRRASFVSYLVAGTYMGVLVGTFLSGVVSTLMPAGAFETWGWRLLFLLSIPFGLTSLYFRRRISETPDFEAVEREREKTGEKARPLTDALSTQWRGMLLLFAVTATYALATYTLSTLYVTYLISVIRIAPTQAYTFSTIANLWLVVFVILLGPLVDRLGSRTVLIAGCLWVAVLSVPAFFLATVNPTVGAIATGLIMATGKGLLGVPVAVGMSLLFPPKVRVTAGNVAYNLAQVIFGGTAPLVAIWLIGVTGDKLAFGYVSAVIALISLVFVAIYYPRRASEIA